MQASELIYMEGNFVSRDSTKQRENASEGAEQIVTIQFTTARVPMIPQPKHFCYHVDNRRTQQYRHSGNADNTLNLDTRQSVELTEGFSLLGGVHSHNVTFRRQLPSPVASFPYS